jgi:hypothetical protein
MHQSKLNVLSFLGGLGGTWRLGEKSPPPGPSLRQRHEIQAVLPRQNPKPALRRATAIGHPE